MDLNKALRLNPCFALAYNNRGNAYRQKGDYDRSIADYDVALRLDPKFAKAYRNRGRAYSDKGDYNQAIENYDNTVRLCPNYETEFIDSNFTHGRGITPAEAGRAIELLDKIVEDCYQAENFGAAAYYSGVLILFSGNKHKARRCFEEARKQGFEDCGKIDQHLANLK